MYHNPDIRDSYEYIQYTYRKKCGVRRFLPGAVAGSLMLQKLEFSVGIKEASSIVCYYDSIIQHIHNTCLHSDVAQIWVVII